MKLRTAAAVCLCMLFPFWLALTAAAATPGVETVTVEARALPGANLDPEKIPGSVQSISAAELERDGAASLAQALDARLGSVSLNDNLGDSQQADVLYRGFAASPVLGTPQGLALYQNGVRVNEAFGDTSNWDLMPEIAIRQIDLVSANPAYGLNALGGAIAVAMKNGFDYRGRELKLSGGSFGERSAAAQWGASNEHFGIYVAGTALDTQGWRQLADESLRQAYAAVTARTDRAALELSDTWADNALAGQGSAPAAELAIDRSLSFTGPQRNLNRLHFLALHSAWQASDRWSLQGILYRRQYDQRVDNGNTTDYTACNGPIPAASLCQADALTPLTGPDGLPLPDISQGGALLIGENDLETIAAQTRGLSAKATDSGKFLGHGNQFTVGAALDFARVSFQSESRVGLIDPQRLVGAPALLVDTPESSAFAATPVRLQALDSYQGLYATDTLELSSAWSLSASARYQVAVIDLRDERGTALSGRNRYAHFNPQWGMTVNLSAATLLYTSVARNTRTPTASEIECSDPLRPCLLPSQLAGDPPALRQVVADSIELGLRSRKSGRWNLGLYRSVLNDDIYGIATSTHHGFFRNIGATRRQGIEAGMSLKADRWSGYLNYSYTEASFQSALVLPSPSNPFQDAHGNIQVRPGDQLPGIARHRIKAGVDRQLDRRWTLGATLLYSSGQFYFGDEINRNAPLPGYTVIGLRSTYQLASSVAAFATFSNLLNRRYASYGIYSDPTGAGAPGIPPDTMPNGPGVDNRFYTPAAPFSARIGVRINW